MALGYVDCVEDGVTTRHYYGNPQDARKAKEGLGDWMERNLKKIGVTENRYQEAKAMMGLKKSCNCSARKKWLNDVSAWWRQSR